MKKLKPAKSKVKVDFLLIKNMESFKQEPQKINCEELKILNCTDTFYKHFIQIILIFMKRTFMCYKKVIKASSKD